MTGIFMDANTDGRPHWKQNKNKKKMKKIVMRPNDCETKKKQQQQLENKQ